MPHRTSMLATSVRKLIAPVLHEAPRECGIVTMTEVDISRDLSYVTISITALERPETALEFLESRKHDLQKRLGSLGTHKTPRLRFRIDRNAERATKLDALLERASGNTPDDVQ